MMPMLDATQKDVSLHLSGRSFAEERRDCKELLGASKANAAVFTLDAARG